MRLPEPLADERRARAALAWMLDRLESLCAQDTTTGREDAGLPALLAVLRELGADVALHRVSSGRSNVLATWGTPELVFSTHVDTVPPFLPPRLRADGADVELSGRGACDAKGQIVCQLAAVRSLLESGTCGPGRRGLAWLGVVGEETDSDGAKHAAATLPAFPAAHALINGEPTDGRLATGQRGSLQLALSTRGVAAHSGTPEHGRSAIWPLLDWLARLRELPGRRDATLGDEIWNLGLLAGGEALNVVPAHAEAQLFVRTVPGSDFLDRARALAPPAGDGDGAIDVLARSEPDRFPALAGFASGPVPFGSDAPRLRALVPDRTVVLAGPGSVLLAHSAEERITGAELSAGLDLNLRLAARLLGLDEPRAQPRAAAALEGSA
ncbi:MAG TPA: M20/M25/M40 family metallo-hydrolase [Planctomycetota bacterium]|nr:M20/M25/M40 family metallo-hydrolase [Planctomycetota bacterium]